jgi:hypothetical protein
MTPPACHSVPTPAAAPARSSDHAAHPVRRCVLSTYLTLSDSFARRTRGSDSPLESVSLPSHPVAALARAAGPWNPPPVLCSLTGMDKHPHAHNPPGRTPPAPEGTGSQARCPCLRHALPGPGGKTKRRLPDASAGGRSLCRAGPALAIACQEDIVQISCRHGRDMATRRGYRASATTCRAVCPGGPTVKYSAQKRYFVNLTAHSLYFHPAHGGGL